MSRLRWISADTLADIHFNWHRPCGINQVADKGRQPADEPMATMVMNPVLEGVRTACHPCVGFCLEQRGIQRIVIHSFMLHSSKISAISAATEAPASMARISSTLKGSMGAHIACAQPIDAASDRLVAEDELPRADEAASATKGITFSPWNNQGVNARQSYRESGSGFRRHERGGEKWPVGVRQPGDEARESARPGC